MRRSALDRMFPWLHLGALAFGAAGLGFAAYVYSVPYQRLVTELKRRGGDLRSAATEVETRRKELDRLRRDLREVQGARNQRLGAEGRVRSDLTVIKSQLEERLGAVGLKVELEARRMLVRFPERALFEARGPYFTNQGHEVMKALADVLGDRAARLLIAAPMGHESVPRWIRAQFPTPADLSAARAANALKALAKAGVRTESALAVIGLLAGPEDAKAEPTLDIEVEGKE